MGGRKQPVIVGIDLAGSARRPTGICMLRGLKAETRVVFSDEMRMLTDDFVLRR